MSEREHDVEKKKSATAVGSLGNGDKESALTKKQANWESEVSVAAVFRCSKSAGRIKVSPG